MRPRAVTRLKPVADEAGRALRQEVEPRHRHGARGERREDGRAHAERGHGQRCCTQWRRLQRAQREAVSSDGHQEEARLAQARAQARNA
eukprot:scaffold56763_cov28-Phaeocystis_antarctica.AAC.1